MVSHDSCVGLTKLQLFTLQLQILHIPVSYFFFPLIPSGWGRFKLVRAGRRISPNSYGERHKIHLRYFPFASFFSNVYPPYLGTFLKPAHVSVIWKYFLLYLSFSSRKHYKILQQILVLELQNYITVFKIDII